MASIRSSGANNAAVLLQIVDAVKDAGDKQAEVLERIQTHLAFGSEMNLEEGERIE